ncbi:hypothetical protein L1987_87068 [Smallanthus sonchifolius]|nr:hypothetical protein L1987_87068 [Smallanthus sonchifolius]
MDDDGLNMRNWGYYEPSFKEHLGLQLISPLLDHRDTKPMMINPNTGYHHQPSIPMPYMRDSWIQRERLLNMIPGNPNFAFVVAASAKTRGKKPKKAKENGKVVKWNMDVVIDGIEMDISGIPIPVCSCTGMAQQCYRWGSGGWQSSCCTTIISMYPLPMSTKRHRARIHEAFKGHRPVVGLTTNNRLEIFIRNTIRAFRV